MKEEEEEEEEEAPPRSVHSLMTEYVAWAGMGDVLRAMTDSVFNSQKAEVRANGAAADRL